MITLVVIACLLIAIVTIYQYREQAKDYHESRLQTKEEQIMLSIDYVLKGTTYEVTTNNLQYIFRDAIYEIADIQNVNFNIYDLDGKIIKSSRPQLVYNGLARQLKDDVLNKLYNSPNKRYVAYQHAAGNSYQSLYVYITDTRFKPIGILNIPYFEDDTLTNRELEEFLYRLVIVYVFMIIIAVFLAYFVSTYITKSLKTISDKLHETQLSKGDQKIHIKEPNDELRYLIEAYNGMIDKLEESAVKLAKSEREQAWREMAKQVAHEIKNPLTPMRLTVQVFQRYFDAEDPEVHNKVKEFSETLIQQIDTMSSIASAFSSFANMPAQQNETLNVVGVVKLALDIFKEKTIIYRPQQEELIAKLDRTQLVRIITNLVKNALQAIPEDKEPRILVTVFEDGEHIKIQVADNGIGISEANKEKIFEPKFTTKTSGMGLGLGMVKNIVETYKGSITFTSKLHMGTVFTVSFPKQKEL
ncbi:two-component sensor histidine kinase [Neptunitalea chrysea]|uniref:histidine kinase n=1 Tax=Neptunitalea chrysea TaxID=1647581 RepID=A0A9W6B7Q3_9FLAO|nr:HAMP domain-containing sensor histidine kinase [Neptunitalea chrysea]GLB53130.1 two-component sensor histidine kinase [Neptunitalea chrysea]